MGTNYGAFNMGSMSIEDQKHGKRKLEESEGDEDEASGEDDDTRENNVGGIPASRAKKAESKRTKPKPRIVYDIQNPRIRQERRARAEAGRGGRQRVGRGQSEGDAGNHDGELYNENEEDDVGESSTSESDNSFEAEASFVKTYKDMDPARKWVLSSGMVVEDVIFRKYKNMSVESLAHSWVIDLNNHEVTSLFSPADWKEISGQTLSLPQLDVLMAKSVSRFAKVTTTSGLREVLETTSYQSKDEPYDREKHYDAEWVDLAMRRMLPLFESPDQLLRKPYLEGWYDSNIWSFIVDYALQDLKGMEIVRKESSSLATTMGKNRKRTGKEDRSKIGRRLDAIVKTDADAYYEYGAVEVAKSFRGVKSTKWLTDSLKLAKTLHDMLFRLEELVDHQDSLVKKLRVVGGELRTQVPSSANEPSRWLRMFSRTR